MDEGEKPGGTPSGWPRLVNATRYSLAGLRAAWRHEEAFRLELLLCALDPLP